MKNLEGKMQNERARAERRCAEADRLLEGRGMGTGLPGLGMEEGSQGNVSQGNEDPEGRGSQRRDAAGGDRDGRAPRRRGEAA